LVLPLAKTGVQETVLVALYQLDCALLSHKTIILFPFFIFQSIII